MTEFRRKKHKLNWRSWCALTMASCITLSSINLPGTVVLAAANSREEISTATSLTPEDYRFNAFALSDNYVYASLGQKAELRVQAYSSEGNDKITYQWYKKSVKDKNKLDGETGARLTFNQVSEDQYNTYYCVVGDGFSSRTLSFYLRKQSNIYCGDNDYSSTSRTIYSNVGKDVLLRTNAWTLDGKQLSYSWEKITEDPYTWETKTESLSNTASSLKLSNLTNDSFAEYRCTITDGFETRTTTFDVRKVEGFYVDTYSYFYASIGDKLVLSVNASNASDEEITYQWWKFDENGDKKLLEGQTAQTYTIASVVESDYYNYYYCDVTSEGQTKTVSVSVGNDTSRLAYAKTKNMSVTKGEKAVLEVLPYAGNASYTYEWYREEYIPFDYDSWSGGYYTDVKLDQTSSAFTIESAKEEDFTSYYCIVSDGTTTNDIWFYVSEENENSSWRLEYQDTYIADAGDAVTLAVDVKNRRDSAFQYEWYTYTYDEDYGTRRTKIEKVEGNSYSFDFTKDNLDYYYTDAYSGEGQQFECVVTDQQTGQRTNASMVVFARKTLKVQANGNNWVTSKVGKQVDISVSAKTTAESKITYQWYKDINSNRQVIAGETDNVLSFTVNDKNDFTQYYCVVSDGHDTNTINFYVNEKETVFIPSSYEYYNEMLGNPVTLQADVTTLSKKLTYQWQWSDSWSDFIVIEGETSSSLTINPEEQKTYRCRVTDGNTAKYIKYDYYSVDRNDYLNVSVNGRDTEDYWENVCVGSPYSIEIAAASNYGDEAIQYEWQKYNKETEKFETIKGQTSNRLHFAELKEQDVTEYLCTVKAKKLSRVVTIELSKASTLYFISEQGWYSVAPGQSVTLDGTAVNNGNATNASEITYKWYHYNWNTEQKVQIEGATSATYTIEKMSADHAGAYVCEASNGIETKTRYIELDQISNLTIEYNDEVEAAYGDDVELKVYAFFRNESTETISYEWQYYNPATEQYITIPQGENKNSFVISDLTETTAREYRCVVKTETETRYAYFYIGIKSDLEVWNDTSSYFETALGSKVTMGVAAKSLSNQEITYQWYSLADNDEYEAIEGATSAEYTIESVRAIDYREYECRVSAGREVRRITFELCDENGNYYDPVKLSASIIGQSGRAALVGGTVKFAVAATSNMDITYQWYRYAYDENEQDEIAVMLEGETSSQLTLANIKESDFGEYVCRITSENRSLNRYFDLYKSSNEFIYSGDNKEINFVTAGESVTFTPDVMTQVPLTYQWYKWNEAYDAYEKINEAGASLTVNNVQATDRVQYLCIFGTENKTVKVKYTAQVVNYTTAYPQTNHDYENNMDASYAYYDPAHKDADYLKVTFSDKTSWESYCEYLTIIDADGDRKTYDSSYQVAGKTIIVEGNRFIINFISDGSITDWGFEVTSVEAGKYPVRVSNVSLNKSELSLVKGTEETLTASLNPQDASNKAVVWSTSNASVATVNENGTVTAVGTGEADITVMTKDGNKKAICKVTVIIPSEGIILSQASATVAKGNTVALQATLNPVGSTDIITWSSADEKIASVDAKTGLVTAKAAGTVVITAKTATGKTATCKITVTVPATAVSLDKTSVTVNVNAKTTLKATMNPTDSTDQLTWSTSNNKVATVSNGVVTAKAAGTATITVKTTSGKTATCKVTVKSPAVSVKLDKTSVTVNAGKKVTLKATVNPNGTTDTIAWSTSNAKVATVSNGVVTAKAAGTATITVKTSNGKTATCKVVVKVPAKSIKLSKTSVTMKKGQTLTLKYTVNPTKTTDTITWKTSSSKVATVSKTGKVKAVKKGRATITVRTSSGKTATCKITVK